LSRGQPRHRVAPTGHNLSKRGKHEPAFPKRRMRNAQRPRRPHPARPPDNVEIERTIAPAASATAAMGALNRFEFGE
jgi:hypothetical protein